MPEPKEREKELEHQPEKEPIHMLYEVALLKRVDDFRFRHRFPSRAETIRWLVTAALDKKLVPAKEE